MMSMVWQEYWVKRFGFTIYKNLLVLDVGCGGGKNSLRVASVGCEVVALDISIRNLNSIKELFLKERVYIKTHLIRADVSSPPFMRACFDRIIATEVLEHIEGDEKAVEELSKVMKSNAEILISVPAFLAESLFSILNPRYLRNVGHVRIYSKQRLIRILNLNGLSIRTVRFGSFKSAVKWTILSLYKGGDQEPEPKILSTIRSIWREMDRVRLGGYRLSLLMHYMGDFLFPRSMWITAIKD